MINSHDINDSTAQPSSILNNGVAERRLQTRRAARRARKWVQALLMGQTRNGRISNRA